MFFIRHAMEHRTWRRFRQCLRALVVVVPFAVATMLAGCSGYDVELNGGVFDALGVGGKALNGRPSNKKVAPRQGLVIPPSTASLPVPGSGSAAEQATADGSWPVGPEQRASEAKAAKLAEHRAYCESAKRKLEGKIITELPDGPMGSCHESIFKNLTGKDFYREDASKTTQ